MFVRTFTILLTIYACCTALSLLRCNMTTVDEDDPTTIQLAQLDAIKCQMELTAANHRETLQAISDVSKKIPRSTNGYDVLLYCFSSFFGLISIHQILKCVWYFTLMRVDFPAVVCWSIQRCPTNDFRYPNPQELEEYRNRLSTPWSAYLCNCCFRKRRADERIEML